jgi:hypothetical protein
MKLKYERNREQKNERNTRGNRNEGRKKTGKK